MTKLDRSWAIQQIDAFLHASDTVVPEGVIGFAPRESDSVIAQHAHVVEPILDRATPGWKAKMAKPSMNDKWDPLREAAARGKAALERADELRKHLGDDAPQLDAGQLHPWAWENGASYWRTGHFHQAVMEAAMRINTETQAKLRRRNISETDLFNQAFSLDPPRPDAPRLRLMEDDGSKTYQNLHRGVRAFADGLFSAIRNPGTHEGGELSEQEALEQLAAFSILARWVEKSSVVT
jgi:hypothetical protein